MKRATFVESRDWMSRAPIKQSAPAISSLVARSGPAAAIRCKNEGSWQPRLRLAVNSHIKPMNHADSTAVARRTERMAIVPPIADSTRLDARSGIAEPGMPTRFLRVQKIQWGLRSTGGLLVDEAVAELLVASRQDSVALLARWIAEAKVIALAWRGEWLIPVFQVDFLAASVRPEVGLILAEFAGVFDAWEVAEWFAAPNLWLADGVPAQLLGHDPKAVVGAARADRFIAAG